MAEQSRQRSNTQRRPSSNNPQLGASAKPMQARPSERLSAKTAEVKKVPGGTVNQSAMRHLYPLEVEPSNEENNDQPMGSRNMTNPESHHWTKMIGRTSSRNTLEREKMNLSRSSGDQSAHQSKDTHLLNRNEKC